MALAWPAVLVAVLTGWFSGLVTRQWLHKRKANLFFWSLSLIFACIASISYAVCLLVSPTAWLFQLYYLFGAMLMPCIMGLGSISLVAGRRALVWVTGVVGALGVVGSIGLFMAKVSQKALLHLDGGAGTGVIHVDWWLPFLILLNSFGAVAVIVVALISAWRTAKRKAPTRFMTGNIWLAVGVLIVSLAGSSARLGWPQLFWITMLVGWVVTFVGYVILSPRPEVLTVSVSS